MKQCPQCQQVYSDDTLRFCLSDGIPLTSVYAAADSPTQVLPSPAAPVTNKMVVGVNRWFKYLALGLAALLLLFLGAGIALWMMWGEGNGNTNAKRANALVPDNSSQVSKTDPPVRPSRSPTAEPPATQPVSSPTPKPAPKAADQPVTRINFRRGRVGESISGALNKERGFVLRTLAGQSLAASVRSPGGCAVFDNGSASTSYTTSAGDSYLRLVNNCEEPTQFTLSVSVR